MSTIKLFETKQVRSLWDQDNEAWFFSIVDVIAVLTDSPNPRTYWSVLKNRLKKEGSELATNCSQLKMESADGKNYLTDVANTEQLLRLVQSIPSPKAEPFKQWLARVGYERIEETDDPELAFDRAMETYVKKGYVPFFPDLLQDAILRTMRLAQEIGIRALVVHALHDQARAFYQHHGFSESEIDPLVLMLRIKGDGTQ